MDFSFSWREFSIALSVAFDAILALITVILFHIYGKKFFDRIIDDASIDGSHITYGIHKGEYHFIISLPKNAGNSPFGKDLLDKIIPLENVAYEINKKGALEIFCNANEQKGIILAILANLNFKYKLCSEISADMNEGFHPKGLKTPD